MDMFIDPQTRDYNGERITTLANAVYLRLMTPLGSWWADRSLGSRLHELQREKELERVFVLAKQYAELALKPLLDDGRAESISVSAEKYNPSWCLLHIELRDLSGQYNRLRYSVKVA